MTEPKRTSTAKAALKWLGCYALIIGWIWVTFTIFPWAFKQPFTEGVTYFFGWIFGSAGVLFFYIERKL